MPEVPRTVQSGGVNKWTPKRKLHTNTASTSLDCPHWTSELDVFGNVTLWTFDDGRVYYVIALLPQILSELIQTLGHELFHIWEYENGGAPSEKACDAYGYELVHAVGAELKCHVCGKTMTEYEADESEIGSEFVNELVCDGCFSRMKNTEV